MIRRVGLVVAVSALGLACGGNTRAAPPAPQTMQETLTGFLGAVKANDLHRMGQLWGSARGPAVNWMKPQELS